MVEMSENTFELLKRFYNEFTDFRREHDSMKARLSSIEQHVAALVGDMAQVRVELDDIRSDTTLIKRRLDLVDA